MEFNQKPLYNNQIRSLQKPWTYQDVLRLSKQSKTPLIKGSRFNIGNLALLGASVSADFSPLDISNIIVWYDCADFSTITKDGGDLVSQIDDKSGNADHLVQATGTKQPLWVSNGQNGEDDVEFDGIDNEMKLTSFSAGSISHPRTVFFSAQEMSGDSQGFFAEDNSDNPRFRTIPTAKYDFFDESGISGGTTDPSVWHVYTLLFNTTSSDVRRDGSSIFSGTVNTGGLDGLTMGALSSGQFGDMHLGEFVLYDKVVSGTERTDMETYLKNKWGTP